MKVRHFLLLLGIALTLALKACDSFGFATKSSEAAAERLNLVVRPFYDQPARSNRENIVVITFSDDDVRALSEADGDWGLRTLGPSYSDQRAIIAAAARSGARAIFFDISYSKNLESDLSANLLAKEAELAGVAGAKVLFGPIADTASLAPFAGALRRTGVQWRAGRADEYPFNTRTGHSAAYDLYRLSCADSARMRVPLHCPASLLRETQRPSLMTLWGYGSPPETDDFWADREDCSARAGGAGAISDFFRELFIAMAGKLAPGAVQRQGRQCPYHVTLPGSLVVAAQSNPQADAALRDVFAGRVVLVGGAMKSGGDFVSAPGLGKVPGVFLHAAALDNLFTLGEGYFRSPPNLFLALDAGAALELGVTIGSAVIIYFLMSWPHDTPVSQKWLRGGGAVIAPMALSVAAGFFVLFVLRWAPGDVASIIAAAFAGYALTTRTPWESFAAAEMTRTLWSAFALALAVLGGGLWLYATLYAFK